MTTPVGKIDLEPERLAAAAWVLRDAGRRLAERRPGPDAARAVFGGSRSARLLTGACADAGRVLDTEACAGADELAGLADLLVHAGDTLWETDALVGLELDDLGGRALERRAPARRAPVTGSVPPGAP